MAATTQELERLVVRLVGEGSSYKKTLDDAVAATKKASSDIDKLTKKNMGSANHSMQEAARGVQAVGESIKGFGEMLTLGVTAPITALATAMVKIASDAEMVQMRFETMLGKDQGDLLIKRLHSIADSSAFKFDDLTEAAQRLLAFGFNAAETASEMKMLGDVAAGTHREIGTFAEILGRAKSGGHVTGREMMELTNSGFSLDKVAKVLNMSVPKLNKAVEDGRVPYQALEQAMLRTTQAGGDFHGMMKKAAETTEGRWTTLIDDLKHLAKTFGDELLPLVKEAMAYISDLVHYLQDLEPATKRDILLLGAMAAALGPLIVGLGSVIAVVADLMIVFGPMGLLAIGAFIGIGVAALGVLDVLKVTDTGFGNLYNSIKIGGTGLANWFTVVWNTIKMIWNMGIAIVEYTFRNFWIQIKDLALNLADPFLESFQRIAEGIAGLLGAFDALKKLNIKAKYEAHLIDDNEVIKQLRAVDEAGAGGVRGQAAAFAASIAKDRAANSEEGPQALRELDAHSPINRAAVENGRLEKENAKLMTPALHDDGKMFSFDKDAAMQAVGKIGDNVEKATLSAWDKIKGLIPEIPKHSQFKEKDDDGIPDIKNMPVSLLHSKKEEKKPSEFQQVALNRMSLTGLTGLRPKRQEVEAKGVENRLDKLIQITTAGRVPAPVLSQ